MAVPRSCPPRDVLLEGEEHGTIPAMVGLDGPDGEVAARQAVCGILMAWAGGTGAIWTLPRPSVLTVVGLLVGAAGSGLVIRGLRGLPRRQFALTPRLIHMLAGRAGWPAVPITAAAYLIFAVGMVGAVTVGLR